MQTLYYVLYLDKCMNTIIYKDLCCSLQWLRVSEERRIGSKNRHQNPIKYCTINQSQTHFFSACAPDTPRHSLPVVRYLNAIITCIDSIQQHGVIISVICFMSMWNAFDSFLMLLMQIVLIYFSESKSSWVALMESGGVPATCSPWTGRSTVPSHWRRTSPTTKLEISLTSRSVRSVHACIHSFVCALNDEVSCKCLKWVKFRSTHVGSIRGRRFPICSHWC